MDSQPLPKLYARSLRPVLICQLCHTYGTPSRNLSALSYLWNAVAPYSTFRLRSLCVNGCLPRSSCVNGCLPNTLLTCQDVPGSPSAFLCRVKGHTLTLWGEPGNEATSIHTMAVYILRMSVRVPRCPV